jgi:hypothetical protein
MKVKVPQDECDSLIVLCFGIFFLCFGILIFSTYFCLKFDKKLLDL